MTIVILKPTRVSSLEKIKANFFELIYHRNIRRKFILLNCCQNNLSKPERKSSSILCSVTIFPFTTFFKEICNNMFSFQVHFLYFLSLFRSCYRFVLEGSPSGESSSSKSSRSDQPSDELSQRVIMYILFLFFPSYYFFLL